MKRLILTFDAGGLCNRLFPFANSLAVALEYGLDLVNPTFQKQIGYFCCDLDETLLAQYPKYQPPQFRLLGERLRSKIVRACWPDSFKQYGEAEPANMEQLVEQPQSDTLWVSGLYLLAPTLFTKHADALRSYFRPVESLQREIASCIKAAKENSDLLVGIHIRQGDYAHHDSGMLYYSSEEYAGLMRKMVALVPEKRVKFLVCSNVPQPSELFSDLNICFSPGHEVVDLYALAKCDYLIGAPSSYSQWASFYGEVPRFVHNRKYEEKLGLPTTSLELSAFHIHRRGFGRFLLEEGKL